PILLVAIFCGLRSSELRGLRWSDIDLEKHQLHVRQRADRYNAIGAPKSAAGERTVPFPPLVANALREWKLACPKGDLGLAFPTGRGAAEYHQNILTRGFFPAQTAAGVADAQGKPKYSGLHSLRHFFASWCIARREDGGLGLTAKMTQERMGHSNISVTLDVYSHLFPANLGRDERAAAERRLLG
ncbi:MAG: site-specific integrase, partial [Candidatus Acidiferrum sp.]